MTTAREVELIRACLDDGTYTAQERKDFNALCDLAILALRSSVQEETSSLVKAYCAANDYINALLNPAVLPESLAKIAADYWQKVKEVK